MTKSIKIKIIFIACILSLVAIPVFAAEVFFDTKTTEIKANQLFEASVFINTDGDEINAIEGKITFPQDLLEVRKINDGNSIINFWIEKPKSVSAGQIVFSGVVPGGYRGDQGSILSVTFLAKKVGAGIIEFNGIKALRNDGQGTEVPLTISNFQFLISPPTGDLPKGDEQIPAPQVAALKTEDHNPPEEFTPQIAADLTIFEGKWFLVFATQDKGSGIDYYAIHESRRMKKRIATNEWTEAESPYLLKDQKLKSYIYVKAIDKAGNERIAVVEPRYPLKWYEQPFIWIIIISGVFVLYLIGKSLWQKYSAKNHE